MNIPWPDRDGYDSDLSASRASLLLPQKFTYNFVYVAMQAVNGIVQLLHFLVRNFVFQSGQRLLNLGMFAQSLLANHGDGFVRRKIMTIVFEDDKIKSADQAVGCVSSREINLMIAQGARQQAQIHDAGRRGKMQTVGRSHALVSV